MDTPQTITALVSGLLSVIGGFLGAWLTRRSEFEKWHRQEKAIAIGEYIRQLYDAKFDSSDAYHASGGSESASSNPKVTEPFARLDKHKAIVRLFLSSSNRNALDILQNELWLSCTGKHGPAGRLDEVKKNMYAIQTLLEDELSKVPYRWRWPL